MTKRRIALIDNELRKVSENWLYATEGAVARKYSILVKLTLHKYSSASEFCINIHSYGKAFLTVVRRFLKMRIPCFPLWHADMKKTLSTAFYGRGKRRVYDILIQSEII